jgi:hypothetical protein
MRYRISLPDRLKGLPDFDPPPGGWSRLVNQMERKPPRRRRRVIAPLALAASVVVAVTVAWLTPAKPTVDPASTQVALLMQESQQLEGKLAAVRPQVTVWNGRLAATTASLRNDLAVVDLQLSYAQDSTNPQAVQRLWQNRVSLMSRLVQTHEEATLNPASAPRKQEQYL